MSIAFYLYTNLVNSVLHEVWHYEKTMPREIRLSWTVFEVNCERVERLDCFAWRLSEMLWKSMRCNS